jgi:hypothetical protein
MSAAPQVISDQGQLLIFGTLSKGVCGQGVNAVYQAVKRKRVRSLSGFGHSGNNTRYAATEQAVSDWEEDDGPGGPPGQRAAEEYFFR